MPVFVTLNAPFIGRFVSYFTEGASATTTLARHVRVSATITRPMHPPEVVLDEMETIATPSLGIAVFLHIPASTPPESILELRHATLAGETICEASGLPVQSASRVKVAAALEAPRTYPSAAPGYYPSYPSVSSDGDLYVGKTDASTLSVFEPGPIPLLRPMGLSPLGLRRRVVSTAVALDGTLFLGEDETSHDSQLIAVNADRTTVLWRTSGFRGDCTGLAVLGNHNVVVAGDMRFGLYVHDISTGRRLAACRATAPRFMAYDSTSDMLFVNVQVTRIQCFRWDNARCQLLDLGLPASLEPRSSVRKGYRPLALIPPAPGRRTGSAHLVVGSEVSDTLDLYSLPGLQFFHQHRLDLPAPTNGGSAGICGLTVDAVGSALVICHKSTGDVKVIPWPPMGSFLLHMIDSDVGSLPAGIMGLM